MSNVGIVGVGLTQFTKHIGTNVKDLVELAVERALQDSGLEFKDIGAAFVGSAYSMQNGNGQTVLRDFPTNGIPISNVENACASGSCAIMEAYAWIKAGLCDVAIAVGMESTSWVDGVLPMPQGRWYMDAGQMIPHWYGLQASRYLSKYDLQPEALGEVVVKSRSLAVHNPYAHLQSEVSLEKVMSSRMIATPFTLHQCCPKTDAAGVAILASDAFIKRNGLDSVWIKGARMESGQPVYTDTKQVSTATRVADHLLSQCGIDAHALDVLELHDAFSIGEFIYAEAVGVCEAGGYFEYLRSGKSMPNGGGVAINTSGGLLSRGHPIGATGLGQLAEIVWQLRGQANGRQVEGARIGATMTMGAVEWERDANVAIMFVLES